MTYLEAAQYVASLEPRGWRLGLDRMQAFCAEAKLLGPGGPAFIHVAGTNGKGSVTAFLQSMMVEHGFQTGAFFSPYVVDPRERVQFGRELISEDDFAQVVSDLVPIAERFNETDFGGITEFEFKTAVGFDYWRRKQCEWVALEVGLGGRLDATNVVTPASTAIVSIGLDHMHILGDTVAEIAAEKAGIIKPSIPIVVGEVPPKAEMTICRVAEERGAPLWKVGSEVRYDRLPNGEVQVVTPRSECRLRPGLVGPIQAHNVAVAYAAFELGVGTVKADAAQRGALLASIPGRYQVVTFGEKTVILDGAHNPDAARVLRWALASRPSGPMAGVIGMVRGHEPATFLEELSPELTTIHTAPIQFHRAQPPDEVAAASPIPAVAHSSLIGALRAALHEVDTVLVTGSFYLVGEAIRLLNDGSLRRELGPFQSAESP